MDLAICSGHRQDVEVSSIDPYCFLQKHLSQELSIKNGIQHGSFLGPVLFLVDYIFLSRVVIT